MFEEKTNAYQALYRKYKPSFSQLDGQEVVAQTKTSG